MYQGTKDTSPLDVLFLSAPCRNQCWRWRRHDGGSSGNPVDGEELGNRGRANRNPRSAELTGGAPPDDSAARDTRG